MDKSQHNYIAYKSEYFETILVTGVFGMNSKREAG